MRFRMNPWLLIDSFARREALPPLTSLRVDIFDDALSRVHMWLMYKFSHQTETSSSTQVETSSTEPVSYLHTAIRIQYVHLHRSVWTCVFEYERLV